MATSGFFSESLARVQKLPLSGLIARARELNSAGREVIALASAEPDFETPDNIREAARAALARGDTFYTPSGGIYELKRAIERKFQIQNGLKYARDQIIVGVDNGQLIANAILATINPGDEVILPAPYPPQHKSILEFAGATPVFVDTHANRGFKLDQQDLDNAITARTKWIILNSPGVPTGAVYSRDDLTNLGAVLNRHPHVWVIDDNTYEHFVYDGSSRFVTMAHANEELHNRTLTINSVALAYNMSGWGVGYAGGPVELIQAMTEIQAQLSVRLSSINQAGAVEALEGPQGFMDERLKTFKERQDIAMSLLEQAPALTSNKPEAAFYLMVNCQDLMQREVSWPRSVGLDQPPGKAVINSEMDVARYILETEGIVVMPGSVFGAQNHLRISLAAPTEVVREGCTRIARALSTLTQG